MTAEAFCTNLSHQRVDGQHISPDHGPEYHSPCTYDLDDLRDRLIGALSAAEHGHGQEHAEVLEFALGVVNQVTRRPLVTYDLVREIDKPAEATVYENGIPVFSGVDRSALLTVKPCPYVETSDEGTSHCTLAESGTQAIRIEALKSVVGWPSERGHNRLAHDILYGEAPMTEDGLWEQYKAASAERGQPVGETQRDDVLRLAHRTHPGKILPGNGEEREMGFTETLHHLGVEGLLAKASDPDEEAERKHYSPEARAAHRVALTYAREGREIDWESVAEAAIQAAAPMPLVGDTVSFTWGPGRQEGVVTDPPSVHVSVGNGCGMTVPVKQCSIYRDASVPGSGQTASPSTGDQP